MAATVLFGEADADLRDVFELLFTRAGYAVFLTPDGPAVLEAAVGCNPDLVILNLIGDDGPATCRALRADSRTAGMPVILMSADRYPDARAAASCGAEDYVSKPFDNVDLLARAHALLAGGDELLTCLTPALDVQATAQHAIAAIMNRTHGSQANACLRLRVHAAATGSYLTPAANGLILDRQPS